MVKRRHGRRQALSNSRAFGRSAATPRARIPSLTKRALELNSLGLEGTHLDPIGERRLRFRFNLAAGTFGRVYSCELRMRPGRAYPEMFVVAPDLASLAKGKPLPHVYRNSAPGVKLCLWLPDRLEWTHQMPLGETYIPWTAEWLWYFEFWLATGRWEGGGKHPPPQKDKRWKR